MYSLEEFKKIKTKEEEKKEKNTKGFVPIKKESNDLFSKFKAATVYDAPKPSGMVGPAGGIMTERKIELPVTPLSAKKQVTPSLPTFRDDAHRNLYKNSLQTQAKGYEQEVNKHLTGWRANSVVTDPALTEANKKLSDARKQLEQINRLEQAETYGQEYLDGQYNDNFIGQTKANYAVGRMNQDSSMAWNAYLNNPTEANRKYAERIDEVMQKFREANTETLADDATLPWLSQSFAQYVPQLMDQTKAGAAGAVGGAVVGGTVVPGVGALGGARAGYTAGVGMQSYDLMRGAAFKSLIDAGVDEETALRAANDEALISSLVEMGDAAVDIMTLGGLSALKGGISGAFKTAAGNSAKKKAMLALANYGINIGSEGLEEAVQEVVSLGNARRISNGDMSLNGLVGSSVDVAGDAIAGRDMEARESILGAAKEGAKISVVMAGADAVVSRTGEAYRKYLDAKYSKPEEDVPDTNVEETEQLNTATEQVNRTTPQNPVTSHETAISDELTNPSAVTETQPTEAQRMSEQEASAAESRKSALDKFFYKNGQDAFEEEFRKTGKVDHFNAFRTYYNAGLSGVKISDIRQTVFTEVANKDMLVKAYEAGAMDKKADLEARATNTSKLPRLSGVYGETSVLNSGKRLYTEAMAEAFGVRVKVERTLKQNGFYDPNERQITVAADAETYSGTISHEVGHFIRDIVPENFSEISGMIMTQLNKMDGKSVDQRLYEYDLKLNYDEDGNRTDAYDNDALIEEMVCDGLQAVVMSEKDARELFSKMEQQSPGLLQKLKDFLTDLLNKLRGLIENEQYKEIALDLKKDEEFVRQLRDKVAEAAIAVKEKDARTAETKKQPTEQGALEKVGVQIDTATESAASMKYSLKTWESSDYVKDINKAAEEMAKALDISVKKARKYIRDVNGIAAMIADDKVRLDYDGYEGSAFVSNSEYGGSIDMSTICKKRRWLTGTLSAIQRALPNTALTEDEILDIRSRMKERNYEVSCGLCYVEGSRTKMGMYTQKFIEMYAKTNPPYVPNMAEMNTPEGLMEIRATHPEVYKWYEYFYNHGGRLKDSDPYLFASQQKPKLYQMATAYDGEILKKFGFVPSQKKKKTEKDLAADEKRRKKKEAAVRKKNLFGGLRIQSFSDFEIIHLIDMMQVIMDMARVGLAGQAYTKVPDFAWALGDTGLKINLSLIAKGVDENGRLILDDVEGMPQKDAKALRDRYSDNVGTIIVVFNDEQLKAAMADEFIDFIIPFHRSQWAAAKYVKMGLPGDTRDYTNYQSEKFIEEVTKTTKTGKVVKVKAKNLMPNDYWDFSRDGKWNAENYLRICAEQNRRPKFSHLLVDNGDGSYSLQDDGSTDGYWKLLIDFKMYNNDGKGVPQKPVRPDFNLEQAERMLREYEGGHETFPVAQDIVDEFVAEYKEEHKGQKFSVRDAEYMRAVESGDMVTAQRMVDEAAAAAMPDSAIRDARGNLKPVYHGTKDLFYEFDTSVKGGVNGIAEGFGIYTTDNTAVADVYGNRQLKMYADIKKPATSYKKTIKVGTLAKLIKDTCEKQAQQFVDDGDYDSIKEAIMDTWVSNYVYTYEIGMEAAYKETAKNILRLNDSDMAVVQEVMAGMSIRDYSEAVEFYKESLTPITGFDGYVTQWENRETGGKSDIILAFDSSQLKLADPVTYDNDGNIIPLSERFNSENKDIRWSVREVDYSSGSRLLGKTIDKYLKDYASETSPKYARAYIAYVDPRDFLNLTTTWGGREKIEAGSKDLDEEEFAAYTKDQPIQLWIDHETGEVTGHEGRHRMEALRRNGIDRVPVLLFDSSNKTSKESIRWLRLTGQEFGDGSARFRTAMVRNLIPFNYENRDKIRREFCLTKFDVENEDFGLGRTMRWSVRESGEAELRRENASLMSENKHLQKLNENLKRQFKLTDGKSPDPKAVKRVAKDWLKQIQSKADVEDFSMKLGKITEYFAKAEDKNDHDHAMAALRVLVREAMEEAETLNTEMRDNYSDLISRIKDTALKVTEAAREELEYYGGYNSFRREHFSSMTLSSQNGASIDSFYNELCSDYPEFFKEEDANNEAEQLMRISEVLDTLKPVAENPYGYYIDEYVYDETMGLLDKMADIQMEQTFADKKKAEKTAAMQKLKAEFRTTMDAMRNEVKAAQEEAEKAYVAGRMVEGRNKAKEIARLEAKHLRLKERNKKAADNRKARADRRIIVKEAKAMLEWLANPTDTKHVPEALKKHTAYLLTMFTTGKDDRLTNLQLVVSKLAEEYRKLDPDDKRNEDMTGRYIEYDDNLTLIAEALDESLKKRTDGLISLNNLTAEEMSDLKDMIRMLKKTLMEANKLVTMDKRAEVTAIGDDIIADMSPRKNAVQAEGKLRVLNDFFKLDMLDASSFFKRMSQTAHATIYRAFRKGLDKKIRYVREAAKFMNELVDKKTVKAWRNTAPEKFELTGGVVYLNIPQIMSVYCLSRREQGKRHLYSGGVVGDTRYKLKKLNKETLEAMKQVTGATLTEADVKTITDRLTDEQKKVAREMQRFMSETAAEWGNETTMLMFGYKKFNEANYFPISVDGDTVLVSVGRPKDATKSLRSLGMTKALNKHAQNPVMAMDIFEVFAKHIDQMSSYAAFVPAISDTNKILNYKAENGQSVKKELTRVMGAGGINYIHKLVDMINGAVSYSNDGAFAKAMVRNMKIAAVGFNARVVAQQPTAIFRAGAIIDIENILTAGLPKKEDWEMIYEYAPIAWWKEQGYYDVNIGRSIESLMTGSTGKDAITDAAMWGAGKADKFTWGILWKACEKQVRKEQPNLTGDAFYEAVGDLFSGVIDDTQVVDSPLHRSQKMREKGLFTQMSTSFMSEPTKTFNMATTALMNLARENTPENRKQLMRTLWWLTFSAAMTSAAAAVVDAGRDDDDDEKWADKWKAAFLGDYSEADSGKDLMTAFLGSNFGANVNPINYLPYMRDLMSIFEGYDIERTDMSWAVDIKNAVIRLHDYAEGDSKYTARAVYTYAAGAFSKVTGVPAKSLLRDMEALENWAMIHVIGTEEAKYRVSRQTLDIGSAKNISYYTERYFRAYNNGDKALAQKIYKDMVENGISEEDLKKKIAENANKMMFDAHVSGDASDFNRIWKEQNGRGKKDSDLKTSMRGRYETMYKNAVESGDTELQKQAKKGFMEFGGKEETLDKYH